MVLTFLAAPAAASDSAPASVRGRLEAEGGKPVLRRAEGGPVFLEGDKDTMGVLRDPRLAGTDFEALGRFAAGNRFVIEPIYKRATFVHRDGKRLMVTYWCAVCAIRSYTPGLCWCCQEDTELDLKETL
ncbi:MAG TPA: hypothetical protein DEH78_09585 [Solibacterales bacterium]|nr:hypothetical protein [Bryobacterales bacterium]